jgi:glucose 1-dehydrogenase
MQLGKRFGGKVCLVTGGGSGIGRATCLRLAYEGAKVLVVDIDDSGDGTVSRICDSGGEAEFFRADVSQSAQVQAAVESAVSRWGHLDVLVNNAATMSFAPLLELAEEEWDRVLDVNLRSVFLLCKYSVPHMPPGGAIVNLSSVHAHATTKGVVPYAASKGAIEAFTRGFSEEMAERRIRINSVAPGAVDTPMLWNNPNVKSGAETVDGAVGWPDNIAAAIAFLASDEAAFITGTTLIADGGRLDSL